MPKLALKEKLSPKEYLEGEKVTPATFFIEHSFRIEVTDSGKY